MEYQYLLAGLEDLTLGGSAQTSADELLTLMREQLSEADWQLLQLVRMPIDDERVTEMKEQYLDQADEIPALSDADLQVQMLYELGAKSRNRFVRDWFEFNQNMNNILAATICRKHGFDINKVVVGRTQVAELIRRNLTAKDFGVAWLVSEFNDIIRIAEIDNLLDREKAQDALRWQWLNEHTLFYNFSVENVLAYWLQSEILHRWDNLTMDEGQRVFRALVADMKKDVKF